MNCILCGGGPNRIFFTDPKSQAEYYNCETCDLRYLDPARRMSAVEEKSRYESHENVAEDPRYQEFLRPLRELIEQSGPGLSVLDFGCGAGPVLKHLLAPRGYKVDLYDPFFYPDDSVLNKTFDFIAASEVVEHLYDPSREFARLRHLLKPGGRLGVMTVQCSKETDFSSWYYRRDPTHVAFYSRETLGWIRDRYAFKELRIHSDRLAEFRS